MATIAISEGVKSVLDKLKQHHRQSYNEVLVAILAKIAIQSEPGQDKGESDLVEEEKKGNEIYKDFGEATELWRPKN